MNDKMTVEVYIPKKDLNAVITENAKPSEFWTAIPSNWNKDDVVKVSVESATYLKW